VWACDIDARISNPEDVLQETKADLGEEAYNIVKKTIYPWKNVHLVQASMTQLPDSFPQFNRIFCISTLEHMSCADRRQALQEFARTLAPGGLVVLTVDYPAVSPEELLKMADDVGLIPAGAVLLGTPPKEALSGAYLNIYRCVLKAKAQP
jgi:ubiquinone/menaquinone biosynthesis C-methylase UbiE